jgi:DNA topoisomerase-1
MKALVIVESPTKAKTIRQYLPKGYEVDSSMGHVRDLPANAKEVPAKHKKKKWANLGINVDEDFEPLYVVSSRSKKTVDRLKKKLKDADELILATDEDREGEGISWHLVEVLKPKVPVKRMVFHEITKEAILEAMENFREIDMNLVQAQEARRLVDRLAGYTISPVLWKKVAPGLSAGRVQSVAVEVLVQRERDRIRFKGGKYWDLKAQLEQKGETPDFEAQLHSLDGKRLANGKDFDPDTGKLKKPDDVTLLRKEDAKSLAEGFKTGSWAVTSFEKNQQKRKPAPPFITSTLQQEANRKFGFSARQTMSVAQKLYENGFITYMRTDSTNLSGQAIGAAKNAVEEQYGADYVYKSARVYGKKSKGAQEAHEAIRPAGGRFKHPKQTGLSGQEFKLYDLIWKRTIATQMKNALLEFTNVELTGTTADNHTGIFKTSGKKILFPGFFRAYVEGSDDPDAALENQESMLPPLENLLDKPASDSLVCNDLDAKSHETKPPARFTEATLVKELEKEGVGRPSTYATIIGTIQDRGYVIKEGKALCPTLMAFAVTGLLENYFPHLVDTKFSSKMEDQLDEIAAGNKDWIEYLNDYYKGENGLEQQVERQESQIDPQEARKIDLPLENMDGMQVMVGRYGPYVQKTDAEGDDKPSGSLPDSMTPADITPEKLRDIIEQQEKGPESLGKHPETDEDVFVLTGRYGPYVQRGEVSEDNKKPKRVSLLKGMKPEDVDLPLALKLLELPRELGKHPETEKPIRAGVGRYGPFVVHDGTFASLKKDDNVLEVELDRGLQLLKEKKDKKRGPAEIKNLGQFPGKKSDVRILDGRYGPYIKFGKTNVSIPKGTDPEDITLDKAVEMIKEKKKK